TGNAERGDKRANNYDPGKAQAGRRTQFGPSSIGSTISDRTQEATAWRNNPLPRGTSNLSVLLCQGLKPPVRLSANIFRGGAAVAGAAFHRIVGAKHRKDVVGDALLDRLHGSERQSVERNILRRRLGHDSLGDMMRLAERHVVPTHQPVGEVGRGGIARP